MRHRFEVIRDQTGSIYRCKKCGNTYRGTHATRIPCKAVMKLAITDKVLKHSKEVMNEVGKGGKDE